MIIKYGNVHGNVFSTPLTPALSPRWGERELSEVAQPFQAVPKTGTGWKAWTTKDLFK
jgi:hypothetical protein